MSGNWAPKALLFENDWKFERKKVKNTMEMILSNAPNKFIKRNSKTEEKWAPLQGRKPIRNTRELTLCDDENQKNIILIHEGNEMKNRAWILSKSQE